MERYNLNILFLFIYYFLKLLSCRCMLLGILMYFVTCYGTFGNQDGAGSFQSSTVKATGGICCEIYQRITCLYIGMLKLLTSCFSLWMKFVFLSLRISSQVDFGCGSGSLLDSLLNYQTSLEKIVGVDISQKSLSRAAKVWIFYDSLCSSFLTFKLI